MRWHALRNPTQQEVSDLRKVCPPGEASPERDVEIATRLLRDRTLYAHAVQAAAQQATATAAIGGVTYGLMAGQRLGCPPSRNSPFRA